VIRHLYDAHVRAVVIIAAAVSTIWAFDAVFALVLLPLVAPGWTTPLQYASSAVFQAVMLPILAFVGTRVQESADRAEAQRERIQTETHDLVRNEFGQLRRALSGERRIEQAERSILAKIEEDIAATRKVEAAILAMEQHILGVVTKGQKH
jgi:hypothetical protein